MLIHLTDKTGHGILVNTDHIVAVEELVCQGGCLITTSMLDRVEEKREPNRDIAYQSTFHHRSKIIQVIQDLETIRGKVAEEWLEILTKVDKWVEERDEKGAAGE